MERKKKVKQSIYITSSLWEDCEKYLKTANCRSKSEYVENAVKFYNGYFAQNQNVDYISNVVTSTLRSTVHESEERINRMLFKMAVELSVAMNVVASTVDVPKVEIERLRGDCVKIIKRLNGTMTYDMASDWQRGE